MFVRSRGPHSFEAVACVVSVAAIAVASAVGAVRLLASSPSDPPRVGIITTVAGTGIAGGLGDFGLAIAAQLYGATGVALDTSGNIFIADYGNHRVRRIDAGTGVITTVAGNGGPGGDGDGGPATSARLFQPHGVAVNAAGDLFIADYGNHRIRKVSGGIITTVAGIENQFGFTGDGGLATGARLYSPRAVKVDAAGNLYIADSTNNRIRKVTASDGKINTIAGNGTAGFTGDGVATSVALNDPSGVAVDAAGNVYISDTENHRIRKIPAGTNTLTTVVGTGAPGYLGEAGPGPSARIFHPMGMSVDAAGDVYWADRYTYRIRKLTVATGIVTTVAGSGNVTFGGDGGEATAAQFNEPFDVAAGASGVLYIADVANNRIRRVSSAAPTLVMSTIAGTGTAGYNGEGSAIDFQLNRPFGVAVDLAGNTYVADQLNHRIRKITVATGQISTVAGIGLAGSAGDNGPATAARVNFPRGVAVDIAGNVYIADTNNFRIRKVTAATGVITTIAGTGVAGATGDNGLATAAQIGEPWGVAVDVTANVYIADRNNHRIRKITAATGVISTVAGTGTPGAGGDGFAATSAQLNFPSGVAVDAAGTLYISDTQNNRIRRVAANTQTITTFAGTGIAGYLGEHGPATAARISEPYGISTDLSGNVYFADYNNQRIRKVAIDTNLITTVAGNGDNDFGGDTGAANAATSNFATGVALDSAGNIHIADSFNQRVRKASVPLIAASNLTVTRTGPRSVVLNWQPQSGVSSYTLKRGTVSGGETVVASGLLGFSVADTNLTPGTKYYYTVAAVYGTATAPDSNEVSVVMFRQTTDFEGDGKTEITVYRPSNGLWFTRLSSLGFNAGLFQSAQWGLAGDLPIKADFDGDGREDLVVYRPSTGEWFIRYSTLNYDLGAFQVYQWGLAGDAPIAGDFDGDGKTDLAVYRPSTGEWFIRYSTQNYNVGAFRFYQWGLTGDQPLVADFDGDGRTDLTVYRPTTGEWFIRYSTQNYNVGAFGFYQWGLAGDQSLATDFDGDGRTDLTVYRPTTGEWFIRYSTQNYNLGGFGVYQWGLVNDQPLVGDFDGDGKTELAVYRPSTGDWFIRFSTLNYNIGAFQQYQWGLAGDTPVAKP